MSYEYKKKKRKKKRKKKLPKEIIVLPNADKAFQEKWYPGRDELNIPHSFRAIFCGPPGSGKSMMVKNLIMRAEPPFEEIYVIHCDPDGTSEYDDIEPTSMLENIPAPSEWPGQVKTLVICDDIDYHSMDKLQLKNLSRLMGYVGTHKNISVIIAQQDSFQIPSIARRCANLFVFWKSHDMDSLARAATKTGMKSSSLNNIFKGLMHNPHDSLWIDLTKDSPMPLRKNGYTPITRSEDVKDVFH